MLATKRAMLKSVVFKFSRWNSKAKKKRKENSVLVIVFYSLALEPLDLNHAQLLFRLHLSF